MMPCWSQSNKYRNPLGPGVVMLGILGLGLLLGEYGASIPMILFFLVLWTPLALFAAVSSRRYSVSAQGLTLYYPFGLKKHYNWDKFNEIALCKVHYAGGSSAHTLAIRCVVGKNDFGPQTAICAREDWSTQLYEVMHFRKIITIYHTPERLAEFQACCPHPIRDYCHLPDSWPKG